MADEDTSVEGALIRGSDGATYFIPRADLDAFRVPDEVASTADGLFDGGEEVSGFVQPGPRVLGALMGPLLPSSGGGQPRPGSADNARPDTLKEVMISAATSFRP